MTSNELYKIQTALLEALRHIETGYMNSEAQEIAHKLHNALDIINKY